MVTQTYMSRTESKTHTAVSAMISASDCKGDNVWVRNVVQSANIVGTNAVDPQKLRQGDDGFANVFPAPV